MRVQLSCLLCWWRDATDSLARSLACATRSPTAARLSDLLRDACPARAPAAQICKIKGHEVYAYTTDIPGADLDPSLKPIIFPYIDLNLQVR